MTTKELLAMVDDSSQWNAYHTVCWMLRHKTLNIQLFSTQPHVLFLDGKSVAMGFFDTWRLLRKVKRQVRKLEQKRLEGFDVTNNSKA